TLAFPLVLLSAAQVLWAQNSGDQEAKEQPSRYELRDISAHGSAIHVGGNVTFQDNPAVVIRYSYQVDAFAKNASKKQVLSWSVRFQTNGGSATGLNLSYSHDYFFSGDVLAPGVSDSIQPSPIRFGRATVNGAPIAEDADSSRQATTASARVEFVQFTDGSTWGDSETEAEVFRERRETFHKLESLQGIYSEQGERAFLDALGEPTTLTCIESVKMDCQNNNDNSSCALGAIHKMLESAHQYGFLEKP
ncbi:MAG: hypothetical protein WBQ13_11715, partial [Terriglobales bacterium]